MIPKIIHSIWLGDNSKPKLIKKCETSWKKYCPEYEFMEWNEKNFNIEVSPKYVKEAYEQKKWAFVSDYIRLWALVEYGGIYLDTDVELISNLDDLLVSNSFIGFEGGNFIGTAVIGSVKDNHTLREIIDLYKEKSFIIKEGIDTTTNVKKFTDFFKKKGLKRNDKEQIVAGFNIYPKDFFAPKDFFTGKLELTNNTQCIHHFKGSWLSPVQKLKIKIRRLLNI